ncbi:MAG: hypothetical protein V4574_11905 [Pseudomonadota bacterium]
MKLLRSILLALALGLALPAAAADRGVRVTLSRGEGGDWLIDYDFTWRSRAWFFPRSYMDLGGKPWRQQSWAVETPGVRFERIGHYDVLSAGGAPLSHVRIRMRPFAHPLSADYTPALAFSDGGLAFYSDHFVVSPVASVAVARTLPADLVHTYIEQPPVSWVVRDPGHRLLLRGKTLRGMATFALRDADTYLYSGNAPVSETAAFAGVIDAGLPAWVRTELDDFTPRIMALYAERLGKPAGGRPMALIAWQGAERNGFSFGGSVLSGMVVMQISGKQVLARNDGVLTQMRWFIGHESAHFWVGQTIRYEVPGDSWIMEGSADLLAIRALERLTPDYDATAALQAEMDECLKLSGAHEPLATAGQRGEHRANYGCGAMLALAAEAALKQGPGNGDVFTFLRGLIAARRADGVVGTADWLARFQAATGDAALVGEVRGFVEKGVANPRAFWARLFGATGVGFRVEGEGLKLG